jgi:hypothetical protein
MANTFKSKTFTGASTAANTGMTVYTVPSTTTAIVIGLNLANISNSSLELMTGNKFVLETGDYIQVRSTVANSLDSILSIMEQT